MTPTQELINKKPMEFHRKTGCSIGTARNYSAGIGGLQKWVVDIVRFALSRGYYKNLVEDMNKDYQSLPCEQCHGTGSIDSDSINFNKVRCANCNGSGRITGERQE